MCVVCNKSAMLISAQWFNREAPQHFPNPDLGQKVIMVLNWCLLLVDPLIVSEYQRNHSRRIRYQWSCDDVWCKGRAQFSMPIPNPFLHNQDLNSWTYWAMKFALSTLLPFFSPTDCTSLSITTLLST